MDVQAGDLTEWGWSSVLAGSERMREPREQGEESPGMRESEADVEMTKAQ